jgi:hypothetical protein
MAIFLLVVFVLVWLLVRSRDRKRQARRDAEQLEYLTTLESRVRALETARAASAEKIPVGEKVEAAAATPVAAARVVEAQAPQTEVAWAPKFSAPAPVAPPQVAVPPMSSDQVEPAPVRRSLSLEERLGANWLNKLGIVILVFGVAFFLAYQLKNLGPAGKVVVGFAVSLTLLVGGLVLERRSSYRILGRAGIGGGWALTFFTTFAMYHVTATKVLHSQALDLVLLLAVALGMVWHSLRYKSQVVTGLAFLLAFSTINISDVNMFSLAASALLAAGLVFVTSREHWAELELAGVVAVYGSHFWWLTRVLALHGGPGHPFPEFYASAGLILMYWAIFRVAYVWRIPKDRREDLLTSITAVLNSAGLLGLLKYQSSHPEWAFWALLALGAAEMVLAFLARLRRRTAFVVLSTIAAALLLAAVPFRYHGAHWSLLWVLEAEVLFVAGVRMREVVFRRLGILAGFVAAVPLFAVEIVSVATLRNLHPDFSRHWPAALALALGAAAYWGNGVAAVRRWPEIAAGQLDHALLQITSYLGLAAAAGALWVFFPNTQTALAWMVLVVALGFVADKLASGDLSLQTDILAAAVLFRSLLVNLETTAHWGWLTQRAITLGIVSLLFYVSARRKRGALEFSGAYIAPAYTWAGSLVLALLLWYELLPVAVAVAWAVLGLVLLEIGILKRRAYLRHQAWVLLAASFARIFFVNLNAAGTGQWLSPRNYTVVPLVAVYFWAYERLRESRDSRAERIATNLACCFGTVALAALIYFEARPEWVVIGWAALVFVLLAVTLWLGRRIFLLQGLVLAVAVFVRALLFNLTASVMLHVAFWEKRWVTIGLAAAILFLALPLAFRLRRRETVDGRSGWRAWGSLLISRPEQLLFFAPLLLVTILLAHEMRAGMITVGWSALGVAAFLLALLVGERSYRLAGLGLLLLGVAKILFLDIWHLSPTDRYITLIAVGVALLLVSFLYTRYRETILKFL